MRYMICQKIFLGRKKLNEMRRAMVEHLRERGEEWVKK